jgi:hypothetical protein
MRTLGSIIPVWRFAVSAVVSVIGLAPAATAQTTGSGKWEIEFHGGGMLPANVAAGAIRLPGHGGVFTTSGIYGPPAPPVLVIATSRRESSWYFGDGAALFNQTAIALAANPVAMTAAFPGRVITLDPVLGRSLGRAPRAGSIGMRVSRELTRRLAAELSVDYSLAQLQITQANSESIEATRASFIAAFDGLITSNPGRILRSLTSTAALDHGSAHQVFTSGALIINLRRRGRVVPYAAVGASLNAVTGTLPRAMLNGNYQFQNATGAQFNESDDVTVKDARATRSAAGIVGGGVKYHVSPRWGLRMDGRVSLSRNNGRTVVEATPNVVLGTVPGGRATLNADPTIQFGNSTEPVTGLGVTAISPSTLSGPPLINFRTFSGTGVSTDGHLAVGLFWRF